MNHRVGRAVFSLVVGLAVAVFSYRWITNPAPRIERAQEEQVVQASRSLLTTIVASDSLQIVDPLAPDRNVGKVYIYAEGPGWAVSGYYRRDDAERWHPYLINLSQDLTLLRLKVQDARLSAQAADNPALEIVP